MEASECKGKRVLHRTGVQATAKPSPAARVLCGADVPERRRRDRISWRKRSLADGKKRIPFAIKGGSKPDCNGHRNFCRQAWRAAKRALHSRAHEFQR